MLTYDVFCEEIARYCLVNVKTIKTSTRIGIDLGMAGDDGFDFCNELMKKYEIPLVCFLDADVKKIESFFVEKPLTPIGLIFLLFYYLMWLTTKNKKYLLEDITVKELFDIFDRAIKNKSNNM